MNNTINRRETARELRTKATDFSYSNPAVDQVNNDDESICLSDGNPGFIGNFTKGLHHNADGEVVASDYNQFVFALNSGKQEEIEKIPMGAGANTRKFVNPQAGLAFDLEGPDSHSLTIPPAPCVDGEEIEAEMAEMYWMALLRDVKFRDYATNPLAAKAADSLATFANDFTSLKDKQTMLVSPNRLFRGFTKGDGIGPYVSQFMLIGNNLPFSINGDNTRGTSLDGYIRFGTQLISQKQYTVEPGIDYLTDFASWLKIQNGEMPSNADMFEDTPAAQHRYITTARDLAHYVHFDQLYQAYFNACLLLLGMDAPFDRGNPYKFSKNQMGFGTFGGTHILTLVTEVATRALKAVWHQKWFVHRRLRPEAFGGLIEAKLRRSKDYSISTDNLEANIPGDTQSILDLVFAHNQAQNNLTSSISTSTDGSYLLPQAFPEGSPMHPAYGAGHATVAGACVTILKAFFDESFKIPSPVVPNSTGDTLELYTGADKDNLTVGGELNKLAANIAIGRNMAGVHWRTDYTKSLELGEKIAIGILREQSLCFNEDHYFTLTKFDGKGIRI